ncbi:interleukin-4 receptor subunit alpha-like isoform X2 [Saccopteryx leptura]|uniref:interleukin-4 receptor subunit alpha-like isoform X2 n=2 Tax=Saccopteryx leptura TaxID=249018 RepID=UPI00339CF11B
MGRIAPQVPSDLPMGRLGSGLMLPVSCLILVWAAGSGSVKVLHQPTCFSDYIRTSTCEWRLDGPTNCSAELRLTYQLKFWNSKNLTCVPENRESTVCLCDMLMDVGMVIGDTYQLDLWAGTQLLWNGSFKPSDHVKPPAPRNLTAVATISRTWQLTWSNPYPSDNILYSQLSYLVNMSNDGDPTEFSVHNVTYKEPILYIPDSTLKPGANYSARVKAWVPSYNSSWSEWSPSVKWFNYYKWPWEKHLPLAVSISCLVILVICLSCYFSILKIKKAWWDQIPNPAHSPLMAIVQEPQVPPWQERPGGQEPAKSPHWKTCLTKLLPCLLEHGVEQEGTSSKAARKGPFQSPGKPAWCPVEVGRTVLWPESISVVKCVELLEAPGESEEEEVEEGEGSFCPSPESSGGGFQESRADIAAQMTESLFLDLLGGDNGGFWPQSLGESCLLPPADGVSAPMPWAELPSEELAETSVQGRGQPFYPEPAPPATLTQSAACLAVTETPAVITDNPSYRSLSSSLSRSSGPAEPDADPELAEPRGEGDPGTLSAPQPSEPETWEQVLRRSILQHGAAPAPAPAPAGGYREFVRAVQQGSAPGAGSPGFSPSGDAGYRAFSSLLTSGDICPGPSGAEVSSGEGSYRPFQSLASGCPGVPGPLFTFGLDTDPPHSPQNSLLLGSSPERPGLEPVAKGEDSQKPLLSLEQATDPLRDDLGSGIVYSALTCHLCGHLKQCHGQEERGEVHVVASPCCGCCCGDRSEPPVSPPRAPDPLPGGVPLEASLPPASPAPFGVLKGGTSSPSFQPGPSSAQSSSQTPKMAAAMLSTGPMCTSAP